MTASTNFDSSNGPMHKDGRPPRAVVGSQISRDEEMFGALYDRKVVRRFGEYVRPYRRNVILALVAVLVGTGAQLAIPLVIRYGIDHALLAGDGDSRLLAIVVGVFGAIIALNYAASWVDERLVGLTGEHVIFDLRRAMFGHLQKVALTCCAVNGGWHAVAITWGTWMRALLGSASDPRHSREHVIDRPGCG